MQTYYAFRLGVLLAGVIPHRLAYWLCSVMGNALFYLSGNARRTVQGNLRHVFGPQVGRRKLNRTARGVFRNMIKNYYELFCLPHFTADQLRARVRVIGAKHMADGLQGGRGAIIFTGHIGNFNLASQLAVLLGYPANIVAEQMHPPILHEFVNGLRERFGLKLIPLGPDVVRGVVHALRHNELLGLAADRDLTANSIPITFFGAATELPSGLAALSLRLRVPLIPIHVMRLGNDRSVALVYPPLQLTRSGDRDSDVRAGTQQVAQVLEAMIRRTPDQWVVMQPVWPDPSPAADSPSDAAVTIPVRSA